MNRSDTIPETILKQIEARPLVWEDWSSAHRTNLSALTEFGRYSIVQLNFPKLHFRIDPPHGESFSAETPEGAKTAAQTHHEERLLASLKWNHQPSSEMAELALDILAYLEGEAPGITSGGQRNSALRKRISAALGGPGIELNL